MKKITIFVIKTSNYYMKNIIYTLLLTFILTSCNQEPFQVLGKDVFELKNKGICERNVTSRNNNWSLIQKEIDNVSFNYAQLEINNNNKVKGVNYEKNITGNITKSDVEKYQRDFNSLDASFSNMFKKEGKFRQSKLLQTHTYIEWQENEYKVLLHLGVGDRFVQLSVNISLIN